jgi:Protein of unknown function (DUF3011)
MAVCVQAQAAIDIICSSERGGRQYCQADTGDGVQLLKQLSAEICRKGYSWGQDGSGIWVDHGCKADFSISALGLLGALIDNGKDYAQAHTFQCVPGDKKRHYCQADTRGGIRLVKAVNGAACVYGKSWGYDAGGVWVERKCQAEFEVGGGASYRPPEVPGTGHIWGAGNGLKVFTCSSEDGKRRSCDADTGEGAVLVKDLGGSACARGETWGFDRHGVWVDRGCKAEFHTVQRETILK